MVKILFLCVFLVNIVFFFWQNRKGAPEIYLPPNYDKSIGSENYIHKIMLLSEISEAKLPVGEMNSKNEMHAQQLNAPFDTEVGNETLLIETKRPVIANIDTVQTPENKILTGNDFVGPIYKAVKLIDEENSRSKLSIESLPALNAPEGSVDKNSPEEQLNTRLTQTDNNSELKEVNKVFSEQVNNELLDIDIHNAPQKPSLPLVACYQLKGGEHKEDLFVQESADSGLILELFEQQHDINNYLVLTLAAVSPQEAENLKQAIKQQGIDDIWLFKQGFFRWRISLGMFSKKEQADKAKELLSEQIKRDLEVVPNYQTTSITYVKISTHEEQEMTAFEQKYSVIIDRKIECYKE